MNPDPDSLVQQFGVNPHQFVWILRNDCENPYLDLKRQSSLWQRTLSEYPIVGFDHTAWWLWAISDNGDLFFHRDPQEIAIGDSRAGSFSIHAITPEECLESLPELLPAVFA